MFENTAGALQQCADTMDEEGADAIVEGLREGFANGYPHELRGFHNLMEQITRITDMAVDVDMSFPDKKETV